jgi:hypothetical protein
MQLAGSKVGGWVYTESDPEIHNGNSGLLTELKTGGGY